MDPFEILGNMSIAIDAFLRMKDSKEARETMTQYSKSFLIAASSIVLGLTSSFTELIVQLGHAPVMEGAANFVASVPFLGLAAQVLGLVYSAYQLYKIIKFENRFEDVTGHKPHTLNQEEIVTQIVSHKYSEEEPHKFSEEEWHKLERTSKLNRNSTILNIVISVLMISLCVAALANPVTGPVVGACIIVVGAVQLARTLYNNRESLVRSLKELFFPQKDHDSILEEEHSSSKKFKPSSKKYKEHNDQPAINISSIGLSFKSENDLRTPSTKSSFSSKSIFQGLSVFNGDKDLTVEPHKVYISANTPEPEESTLTKSMSTKSSSTKSM
jgi:hypothetical protein